MISTKILYTLDNYLYDSQKDAIEGSLRIYITTYRYYNI